MNAVPGVPCETTLRREVGGAEDVNQSLTNDGQDKDQDLWSRPDPFQLFSLFRFYV